MSDEREVVASLLRPEEAGLIAGALQSAGIDARLRDDLLSAVNPLLQGAVEGVKVTVPAAEAARAREIIAGVGLAGGAVGEPAEIPEEEWAQGAAPPAAGTAPERPAPSPTAQRALVAAVIGLFVLPPLLHLYSLHLVARTLGSRQRPPGTLPRLAIALVLDLLAVGAATALVLRIVRG